MKQFEKDGLIVGGIYRHYKGGMYRVLDVATFTEPYLHYEDAEFETILLHEDFIKNEKMVVYRSIEKEPKSWVRPLDMFTELVIVNLGNGFNKSVKRFEFVE